MREILAGNSCGKFLLENLAGKSCRKRRSGKSQFKKGSDWWKFSIWKRVMGSQPISIQLRKILQENLAGNCCGKLMWENLARNCCGKILWEILVGKSCRKWRSVKVCPWCGVGLLRLFFLCCGVINKLTLLLVLAAPVKRKGARGEVRFPETPLLCALFYLKGPAPCCYWLAVTCLSYVLCLSLKVVLSRLVTVL